MNQILMVETKKKKKKEKRQSSTVEIANIVRFFAVIIILFGISFIGQGSYAMYKESKGNNKENLPIVEVSRINSSAIVNVNSMYKITYLKYSWSNSEETSIPVEDSYVEEEILLPNENSILTITIEEDNGRAVKFQKEFVVEGLDLSKPTIDITQDDAQGNVKITATDETKIQYITYKINDKEEIRIDRAESEEKTINYVLKLDRGTNVLQITAVDTSGNIAKLQKTIIVSEKPTMELRQDNGEIWLTIKDNDGLQDVEIILNGVVYAKKDIKEKEIRTKLPLQEGKNSISVKVTNINGLTIEGVKELDYAH